MKNATLIYHILIDRFSGYSNKHERIGFNGGTIRGIINRLDHIQGLGADAILLSPFYQSVEYHGYHITDYDKIDSHFGCWDDIKKLVNLVHKRGMKIAADFVPNHCHEGNKLFQDAKHKDWFKHRGGKNVGYAGIDFLPVFDLDNTKVRDYMTGKVLKLCKYGFDAIRIDHASGASYDFLRALTESIHKKYPEVLIIGEILGDLDFKPYKRVRYLWNRIRNPAQDARQMEYVGILDGVIDFAYQGLMKNTAHNEKRFFSNPSLRKSIDKHFRNYPEDFTLWLLLDNHDLNRFLFECNGDIDLMKEAIAYSKSRHKPLLYYYGTEFNFTNTKDIHDGTPYADEQVRQCMEW